MPADVDNPRRALTRSALIRRGAVAAGGAWALTAGAEAEAQLPDASASSLGVNVRAFGAVPDGSTDCSAAFQAAYEAVAAGGGTVFVPRGTYVLRTPLKLRAGAKGWFRLVGEGVNSTVIRGGGGNGQLTQFDKSSDYQTFRNIELTDFTFECDGSPNGRGHVLIGTMPWTSDPTQAAYQSRLHVRDIALRRVRAANVPTAGAGTCYGVNLAGAVEDPGDSTQLYLTDIVMEDVRIDGGAFGIVVFGTARSGSLTNGDVRVFLDRISFVRCRHDPGSVPTAFGKGGNFTIGGVGFGGSCRIRDCYGANSRDVGIEVDGMTDAVVDGCTIVDAYKNHYVVANFRRPDNLAAQRYLYTGCVARNFKVDPSISGPQPHHWALQADPSKPHYEFGHLVLSGCQSRGDTPLSNFSVRGSSVYAANARYRGLTIRDFDVGLQQLAIQNGTSQAPSLIDIAPVTKAMVRIDGVHFRLDGSRGGAGKLSLRYIRLGGKAHAQVDDVSVETLVGGMSKATDLHRVVDIGDVPGSAVRADLRGVRVSAYSSPADVRGIAVSGTATLAVPAGARIVATACDFAAAPGGAGVDYDVHTSQIGRFVVRNVAGQRPPSPAGAPGPFEEPTPIAVPSTSPFKYVNADHITEDVIIAGGTVTAVEHAPDGSAFQATGLKGGIVRLDPGQAIRIAFSAPPKLTKVAAA